MKEAQYHHVTLDDRVVDHVGVTHERHASDAGPRVHLLCAAGKVRYPPDYTSYTLSQARGRSRVVCSDIGKNGI